VRHHDPDIREVGIQNTAKLIVEDGQHAKNNQDEITKEWIKLLNTKTCAYHAVHSEIVRGFKTIAPFMTPDVLKKCAGELAKEMTDANY